MNLNTHIPEAHLRGPLSRPECRADMLDTGADVRSPITKPNALVLHKPPRLELELVPLKRLTARPWKPTCLVSDATHTVF